MNSTLHGTFRWLKLFNVSLASEPKQRALAKGINDDNIKAEMVPFAFPAASKTDPDEFKEAAFVFVPNIIAKVADRLSEHMRY